MKQNEERMAIAMAKIIHRHLESGLGITGGVTKESGTLDNLRRSSDSCIVSQKGLCNKHKHKEVPEIKVTECNLPFRPNEKLLENSLRETSFTSGLEVTNTVMRGLAYDVPISDLNKCTFAELKSNALLPVIAGLRPEAPQELWNIPIEDFRGWKRDRPKWSLIFSEKAQEYKYYTWLKNGSFGCISHEDMEKVSTRMYPHATGIENDLDFGTLIVKENPYSPGKKVVMVGGCHWLGTLAVSAALNLVAEIPELGNGKTFRNPFRSMAWLYQVAEKEKMENFQAIYRVSDSWTLEGRSEVEVHIVGVFSLDK